MHRDRIRLLLEDDQHRTLSGANEVAGGLPLILQQLDAAHAFVTSQTEENQKRLEELLNDH